MNSEFDQILDEVIPVELGEPESIPEAEQDGDVTEFQDEAIVPVENPEAVLEAILFSMGHSVGLKKLAMTIGREPEETQSILNQMIENYQSQDRGIP